MPEKNEKITPKPIDIGDYQFGFHDDVTPIFSTGKGISEAVVREMSAEKGEPEWMLEFRLKSLEIFNKMPMQDWGPDLSDINFDEINYYQKASDRPARSWDDVPDKLKKRLNVSEFLKLNVPTSQERQLSTNQKSFIIT